MRALFSKILPPLLLILLLSTACSPRVAQAPPASASPPATDAVPVAESPAPTVYYAKYDFNIAHQLGKVWNSYLKAYGHDGSGVASIADIDSGEGGKATVYIFRPTEEKREHIKSFFAYPEYLEFKEFEPMVLTATVTEANFELQSQNQALNAREQDYVRIRAQVTDKGNFSALRSDEVVFWYETRWLPEGFASGSKIRIYTGESFTDAESSALALGSVYDMELLPN